MADLPTADEFFGQPTPPAQQNTDEDKPQVALQEQPTGEPQPTPDTTPDNTEPETVAPEPATQEARLQLPEKTEPLPSADEFFAPKKPSIAVDPNPTSNPAIHEFFKDKPVGRIMDAFGTAFVEGGEGGQLGIEPGGDVENALKKYGIFNDYSKGQNDILKAFNEALIRPAAILIDTEFRGAQAAMGAIGAGIQQTSVEADKLLPKSAQGLLPELTEYMLTTPAGMEIHAIPPEITKARSVGAIGESEASYFGLKEPTPEQALARTHATNALPIEEAPKDIHAIAREVAPETFAKYDELNTQKENIRSQIEDLAKQRDEELQANPPRAEELKNISDNIDMILDKVNGVESRLTKKQAATLEDLRNQHDTISEEAENTAKADTPEMAAARAQLQKADYAIRDIAPDVSSAYREAQNRLPTEEPTTAKTEEQPAEEPKVDANGKPIKPIEDQLSDIAGDVSKKLYRAGRSADEADTAAQLIAQHYKSISEQGWAKGTPEEIYKRDAANIISGKEKVRKTTREFAQGDKNLSPFESMTKKEFLGEPRITGEANAKDLKPKAYSELDDIPKQSFMDGKYQVKFGKDNAAVFDGDKVIAMYSYGDTLVVDKKYRRQGIGEELVYQWRTKHPDYPLAKTRTAKSQALQEKVWERIQSEIKNQPQLEQKARGKIRLAANNIKATITLFKTADASTFIHETGHHWLDEMMRYSKASDAPESLIKSKDAVNKWLGVKDGEEITRAQHEKFARGFERYMMEGTAPSRELANVFAKFKQWLTNIYQTARNLKSPITDDIRDVFDRMLSSKPEKTVIAPEKEPLIEANDNKPKLELVAPAKAALPEKNIQPSSKAVETPSKEAISPSNTSEAPSKPIETPSNIKKTPRPEKAPPSLLEWISKNGGIKDIGGDLKAMGADDWHKGKVGAGKLIKDKGMSADDAALKAWEAGYFPEAKEGERPTIQDLHDKIDAELKGGKQYPNNFIKEMAEDPDYVNHIAEQMSEDERDKLNAEIAEYKESVYNELEKQEEEARGDAWEPPVEKDTSATLEDLEDERRQEESATATQTRPSDNERPESSAETAPNSTEGVPSGGGVAETAGRTEEKTRSQLDPTIGRPESKFVDKAGNIRLDNLNTPEDINFVIRDMADKNDNFSYARRGKISDGQVIDLAADLGMDAHELNKRKLGQAFNAEQIVAARKLLIQSATKVRDLSAIAAEGTEEDLMAYAVARARHMSIQEQVSGITAEAGRALRAFRSLEGGEEAKAVGEFLKDNTGLDLFQLQQEARQLSLLDDTQKVSKVLNDAKKATYKDMILEYYINALISGPVTHLRYSVGNALNALWTPLIEVPASAGISALREAMTGEKITDRVYLGEAGAQLHGLIQGSKNGLRAAADAWNTGVSPALPGEELSPMFATKTNALPGTFGKIINVPGKSVSAIHSFFKSIRYEQNIQGLAYRAAMQEGLAEGSEAFTNRVADLGANPTEPMMESATADALRELYMTPTEYNSFAGKLTSAVNSNLAAKIIMPFMKIGTQITRNAFIERTPLGLLTHDVRENALYKEGGAKGDVQLAKMATGVALMGGMSAMVLEGMATGDGPSDPSQRAIWLLNHTPNSLQIGDITLKYQGLGSLGMLMRFSANMTETASGWDDEDGTKLAKSFMEGLTKSVLDENFMRGLKDMLDAVYHPEEYGANYVKQFATNWLPFSVGMGQVARMVDPSQREAHTIMEAAQNKIPFVSEGLQPKRNRFGEIMPNGVDERYAQDPVVQRLESLQIGIGKINKKINGIQLTPQQFDDYSKLAGQQTKMRLSQYVAIPQTRDLPPEIQIKTIHSIIESSRAQAKQIVMMNNPDIYKQAAQNKLDALTGKKP